MNELDNVNENTEIEEDFDEIDTSGDETETEKEPEKTDDSADKRKAEHETNLGILRTKPQRQAVRGVRGVDLFIVPEQTDAGYSSI